MLSLMLPLQPFYIGALSHISATQVSHANQRVLEQQKILGQEVFLEHFHHPSQ